MLPIIRTLCLLGFTIFIGACQDNAELSNEQKPVQHLQLPDITTQSEAWDVLQATSQELRNRQQLDASELNEIHMITYSLEKAIAYFATQSEPTLAKQAQAMAIVVEDLHLHSENNRKEASQAALNRYFKLYEVVLRDF
jgi:hypothetical protein